VRRERRRRSKLVAVSEREGRSGAMSHPLEPAERSSRFLASRSAGVFVGRILLSLPGWILARSVGITCISDAGCACADGSACQSGTGITRW